MEVREEGRGAGGSHENRGRFPYPSVEIHAPYIHPLHRAVYDEVFCPRDAVDFLEAPIPDMGFRTPPERYDLFLSVDMIEHLDEARGQRFLAAAMRRCRTLLVSTPMVPSAQGAAFGNEHERHVSRWKPADFEPFGTVQGIGVGGFWVVAVTQR